MRCLLWGHLLQRPHCRKTKCRQETAAAEEFSIKVDGSGRNNLIFVKPLPVNKVLQPLLLIGLQIPLPHDGKLTVSLPQSLAVPGVLIQAVKTPFQIIDNLMGPRLSLTINMDWFDLRGTRKDT